MQNNIISVIFNICVYGIFEHRQDDEDEEEEEEVDARSSRRTARRS